MARPKRRRRINRPPLIEGFKPFGVPFRDIEYVELLVEEFESIKLTDYEGLTQEQAADVMNVSRPTFTRIYDKARKKVAKAFVEGKAIVISGGNVSFQGNWYKCDTCEETFETDENKEAEKCTYCNSPNIRKIDEVFNFKIENKTQKSGADGFCVCTKCGYKKEHKRGMPCKDTVCDKCGSQMVRDSMYNIQNK